MFGKAQDVAVMIATIKQVTMDTTKPIMDIGVRLG